MRRRPHDCDPPRRFPRDALRYWLFRRSMRRRVFRWLFMSTTLVGALTLGFVHHYGAPGREHVFKYLALALFVLASASSFIARQLARPLEEVARFADALGSGDLAVRLSPQRRRGHDIGLVQSALNNMAERISRQLADQRALLGAVSHELRSPLQRMKIAIELARAGDTQSLARLEREVGDMDRLVGDLLAGSRVDFNAVRKRELNGTELALSVFERLGESPDKLNVEAAEVRFEADPTLALHAVANLVENARRHGGGLRELKLTRTDGLLRFTAIDGGPGFAADELERIFLPFRQTSTSTSVGLGLSIVRRIAEAHGGAAAAANGEAGGAEVWVEFPAKSA